MRFYKCYFITFYYLINKKKKDIELHLYMEETHKNEKESFDLYKKLAEQGSIVAQFSLGSCYIKGTGTEKDEEKAIYWLKKAAEKGYKEAQFNLGIIYKNRPTLGDQKLHIYWIKKAAESGHTNSQCILASIYSSLDEPEKSLYWFTKAAENGNITAQNNLSFFYYGKHEYEKAFYWSERSARLNDKNNQFRTGMLCYLGQGTKQDENQAIYWLEKAANQGHEEAKTKLYSLRKDGFQR